MESSDILFVLLKNHGLNFGSRKLFNDYKTTCWFECITNTIEYRKSRSTIKYNGGDWEKYLLTMFDVWATKEEETNIKEDAVIWLKAIGIMLIEGKHKLYLN